MGNFKQYISETRGRLGLSLQSANKYLSTKSRKEDFLDASIIVEQKSDGLKLTLIKQANTGQAEDDYILAYESRIIYPDEFSYDTKSNIRKNSAGLSQLALVWEHLKKLHKNDIPIGTELFLEFDANKASSKGSHNITLIGHTDSTWSTKQGVLVTTPQEFNISNRSVFAESLNAKTPLILFEGNMSSQSNFSNNINNKSLKDAYRRAGWSSDNVIKSVFNMFLESSTKDEGIIGVVIKYNDVVLKLQENYINESVPTSSIYAPYIAEQAYKAIKGIKSKDMQSAITELTLVMKDITSIEYDEVSLREDIQSKARELLSLKMPGNQGILFVGKFMNLDEKDKEVIKEATIKYDTVTVALLSSKDTKGTKFQRNYNLREEFPSIEIINTSMTNIDNIISKSNNIITKIITENKIGE